MKTSPLGPSMPRPSPVTPQEHPPTLNSRAVTPQSVSAQGALPKPLPCQAPGLCPGCSSPRAWLVLTLSSQLSRSPLPPGNLP